MKPKIIWGLILAWLIALMLFFFISWVRAENVQLQWDYDGGPADGFHIYYKSGGDYSNPAATLEYPDGNIPIDIRQVTIDLPVTKGDVTKFVFIARTFKADNLSDPSNKVFYSVVGIPPLIPVTLEGNYDKEQSIIHVSWEQPQDEYPTHHWRVYARISGESDFKEIGLIRQEEGLELTTDFDLVPVGEQHTCEFVVIAYRRSGVFSSNSEILAMDIDRTQVDPVKNLKLNIQIPVK